MAQFIYPNKNHPERTLAGTMKETKFPHGPNSTRTSFQRAVVVNPGFQQQFNVTAESVWEEDMEPKLMEAPRVQGPRRVAKRENLIVLQEYEWDVRDSLCKRTSLNRSLAVLIGVVSLASVAALPLSLLILFGSIQPKNCACRETSGKANTNLTRRLQSTILELKKVESALVGQSDGLKNAINYITGLLGEQRNIWKSVNATIKETAYLAIKTDEGIETVWFNLNKTRKCCNNLTLSFVLFRTNVDHRSQRLEDRIEVEEQKSNSTRQITLNQTQVLLQSSDASLFASLIHLNTSIKEQVSNVSKMAGPIGPTGFNGSQGPGGPRGAIGPPGPQGSGNFNACQYAVETGTLTTGSPKALASKTERDQSII